VGSFFGKGDLILRPISLLVDPQWTRAFPGGTGEFKIGANYGPTIVPQKIANSKGLYI